MYLLFRYILLLSNTTKFAKIHLLIRYLYAFFFILTETCKINRSEKQKSEALNSNGEDIKKKKKNKINDESFTRERKKGSFFQKKGA